MDKKEMQDAMEKIPVPKEKVFNAISKGLNKNIKRKTRKKKALIAVTITAALLGITVTLGFISPTINNVLAHAPLIGSIFQRFDDSIGIDLVNQNEVIELNQSITKNGVTLKLTSAYFDGSVVSITGFVDKGIEKGNNEEGEVGFDLNFENNQGDDDPWINGMSTAIREKKDGYEFQWKLQYPHVSIKENLILPITIHSINGIEIEEKFHIPVNQEKNNILAVNHEQKYSEEEGEFLIKEIHTAKASSSLIYKTVQKYEGDDIYIYKVVDENGKYYNIGNRISLNESKQADGYHRTVRVEMTKLDSHVKSLTFYPQLWVSFSTSKVEQLLNQKTFTLKSERANLGLQVNNIIENEGELIIDYQIKGFSDAISMSKNQLEDFKANLQYGFLLVDKEYIGKIDPKNPVPPVNHSIRLNKVKMIDEKLAHFQSTFDLNGDEKIENFKLENTILQFDFSIFSLFKELQPFTIEIPVSDE